LEQLKLRHVAPENYKKHLDPLLLKLDDPTKDWVSHFVLRLAYCRTEDFRRWFLAQEVALLKYRLNNSRASNVITKALKSVLPNVHVLSKDELEALLPKILAATPSLQQNPIRVMSAGAAGVSAVDNSNNSNTIYRVPFTQALDLVQNRQVYVHRGQAYIPESRLLTLVTARFRTNLSKQLVLLSAVPSTPAFQRTQGFLQNVATVHALKDEYSGNNNNDGSMQLTAQNVKENIKNMPLCMARLQLGLQRDHHLKHWGRLQYGLFLKGAGLSLEDALVYFERMFSGRGKDFNKEYAYNVRHMYGKEGKRASYPAYNCAKIVNNNAPNSNEHHGCPYKHGSVQEVTQLLTKLGVDSTKHKAIQAQMQSKNYQLACVEHFKALHPGVIPSDSGFGNHPNAWFQASVKATAKSDAAVSPAASSSSSPPTTMTSKNEGDNNNVDEDVDMIDAGFALTSSAASTVSPEK
jgi:DNA primase large subunit